MTRGDQAKLLNVPEPEPIQPQQQPFPRTNLQFGPLGGGFVIQINLSDDIAIVKGFNGEAEEQICNLLIQRRKELKQQQVDQLAVIKHVNATKNN